MRKSLLICVCIGLLASENTMMAQASSRRLSVDELFSLIESGSNTLAAQKTNVGVAQEGIEVAKNKWLPDIDASLSVSYNGNVLMTDRNFSHAKGFSSPHFGNALSVELHQTVYDGGITSTGIKLAELQKSQADCAVALTRSQLRLAAVGQYLQLAELDNGMKVYDSNISLTEKLIADIKARQEQGMALKNDVTRYELQMETLKLGKRQLEDKKSILNHQLCNTLGITDTNIVPELNLDGQDEALLSESDLQTTAAAHSPRMRQAALGIGLAEQQLKLAKSETLPKIAVVAADNFAGPFVYDIPPVNKNFNTWYVGVGVKYTISSLFKARKGVQKAQEQLHLAHDTRSVTEESVNNDVHQALTLYRQAFVELRTRQKSVELASQNYQVVNNRYLNQLALITDMIDASNIKLNAELQEVNAQINILYTYYCLKFATGDI